LSTIVCVIIAVMQPGDKHILIELPWSLMAVCQLIYLYIWSILCAAASDS